jgi:paraquat-inducible protein B
VSRGRRGNPLLVGAFVLGAAALAIGALLVFGSGRFFRKQVELVSYFSGSVNGLALGAPVKFRGVPIGSVSQIRMGLPMTSPADIRIPVWFTVDVDKVSEYRGAPFRLDRQRVDELVAAGMRTQLQTESFVTGVLYVGLDFFPGSPAVLEHPEDHDVLEIPAMPTTIERAMQTFDQVMRRVENIDIEGLTASARSALDGVDKLARSPRVEEAVAGLGDTLVAMRETLASVRKVSDTLQPGVGPSMEKLDATVVQARTSLASLDQVLRRLEPQLDQTLSRARALLDPDAPLAVELTNALSELGETARTFRDLADYLDRNPNAILTGRPKP